MTEPRIQGHRAIQSDLVISGPQIEAHEARRAADAALSAFKHGRGDTQQMEAALGRLEDAFRRVRAEGDQGVRLEPTIVELRAAVASLTRQQAEAAAPAARPHRSSGEQGRIARAARVMQRTGSADRATFALFANRPEQVTRFLSRTTERQLESQLMRAGLSRAQSNELAGAITTRASMELFNQVRGEIQTTFQDASRAAHAVSRGGEALQRATGAFWGEAGPEMIARLETAGAEDTAAALSELRGEASARGVTAQDIARSSELLRAGYGELAETVDEGIEGLRGANYVSPFSGDVFRNFPQTAARVAARLGADEQSALGTTDRDDVMSTAVAALVSSNNADRDAQLTWAKYGSLVTGVVSGPLLAGGSVAATVFGTLVRGSVRGGLELAGEYSALGTSRAASAAGLESVESTEAREGKFAQDVGITTVGVVAEAAASGAIASWGHGVTHLDQNAPVREFAVGLFEGTLDAGAEHAVHEAAHALEHHLDEHAHHE